MYIH
jgi:serine/threonine protein kinase